MKLENFIRNNNLVIVSEFVKSNSTQFNRIKAILRQHTVKNLTIFRMEKNTGHYTKNLEYLMTYTNSETVSNQNTPLTALKLLSIFVYLLQVYPVVFLNGFYIGGLQELNTMDISGHLKTLLASMHEVKKEKLNGIITFFKQFLLFRTGGVKFDRI